MTESTSGLITVSASKLKTFSSCPRKYYYEYVDKQPKEKHPAAALGSAVHKTIELVYKNHVEPVSTFLTTFDAELQKYEVTLEGRQKSLRTDGIRMVGDYQYEKRTPTELELEFRLAFPNQAHPLCMMHGYLDQIYDWGFVDLKTNGRKPLRGVLDNDLQFIIYHWAFKELYGYDPDESIWHHLRTGEDLQADVAGKEDDAARVIERILETDVTGVYDKNVGDACVFCSHKLICLGRAD